MNIESLQKSIDQKKRRFDKLQELRETNLAMQRTRTIEAMKWIDEYDDNNAKEIEELQEQMGALRDKIDKVRERKEISNKNGRIWEREMKKAEDWHENSRNIVIRLQGEIFSEEIQLSARRYLGDIVERAVGDDETASQAEEDSGNGDNERLELR